MAANAPTSIVRKRPNPLWKHADRQLETYGGSPLDIATSVGSLNRKARDIVNLIDQQNDQAIQQKLIGEHFKGFNSVAYQDSVNYTAKQIIKANEHYDRTITFNVTPLNYFSLDANLIVYMTAAKQDKQTAMGTATATVEKFWPRYFTSIKVKKQGDINTININSDDTMTPFELFLDACGDDYIKYETDLLTTTKHRSGIDKSQRANKETNASLDERIANFRAKMTQAGGGRYVIPLKCLCNMFNITILPPETELTIEISVNQNALQLFETKTDSTDLNRADLATMVLNRAPELEIELVDQTPTHQLAFEQYFTRMQRYRLWDGFSWEVKEKEIATGSTQVEVVFLPKMYQYKWLQFSLKEIATSTHPNMFSNYDYESILRFMKTIKITGLYTTNSSDTIEYDVTEAEDMDDLYRQYLAQVHGYVYSRAATSSYRNSDIIKNVVKRDQFLTSNLSLWLDISQTRGFTVKPDPPNQVVNPNIKIVFKQALTKAYIITVKAFYPSQYLLSVEGSAATSTKVIKYLPSVIEQR